MNFLKLKKKRKTLEWTKEEEKIKSLKPNSFVVHPEFSLKYEQMFVVSWQPFCRRGCQETGTRGCMAGLEGSGYPQSCLSEKWNLGLSK